MTEDILISFSNNRAAEALLNELLVRIKKSYEEQDKDIPEDFEEIFRDKFWEILA